MADLDGARAALAEIDRTIAKLDHETRERITRRTGMDGDHDLVSRDEWGKFYDQVRPLRAEREAIVAAMVDVLSADPPAPMLVPSNLQ